MAIVRLREEGLNKTRQYLELFPGTLEKTMVRALNIVGKRGITAAVREIRKVLNIKAKDARESFSAERASLGNMVFTILGEQKKPLPLSHYKVWPGKAAKGRPPVGLSVLINKLEGRKVIRGAFWQTMKNGGRTVFKRLGLGKLPIGKLFASTPVDYLQENRPVLIRLLARLENRLVTVFNQEMDYGLLRATGGA